MDEKQLENLRARADAKLRYAEIHLKELLDAGKGGSDFERAHLESYLFHLFGARDAFLVELISYYSLPNSTEIRLGEIRKALKAVQKSSPELGELHQLDKNDPTGWFVTMKRWRDHVTHIGAPRHHFKLHIGGEGVPPDDVEIEHPETNERIKRSDIAIWLLEMKNLLERLRESAIANTGSKDAV